MPSNINTLEIEEGIVAQESGAASIAYTLDVAPYPGSSSPSAITETATKIDDESDVSSAVFPAGSSSVAGNIITLKPLTALVAGVTYRIEVEFTRDGNTFRPFFRVQCPY